MPQPVKPATNSEATRPFLLGKRELMCSCDKWKVMPARPRITEAGASALSTCGFEMPTSTKDSMVSRVPATTSNNLIKHGRVKGTLAS